MTKPKKIKRYIARKTFATILLLILVASLIVATFALTKLKGMIDQKPELDVEKLKTAESSIVYDADGKEFAEIGLKLSDNIKYEELPNNVIDAFISIEDSKYFGHEGFDLARFTNESIQTVLRILKGGGFGAGASTITMQTIKNSFFSDDEKLAENSIDRKAQEISLSMDLEKVTTKEEILEFYLNKINFGVPKSRGIAKAALYYFNKKVGELNLSEAAYLAGVINEPANLNAYHNLDNAIYRRNTVLDMMLRHGYISKAEHDIAVKTKLENQLWGEEKYYGDIQPHQEYLDAVIEELQKEYGLDPYTQGLKVYTALNRSQQKLVEDIEANAYGNFYDDVIDGAFVTLNNQTGEIIALGGGRKFEGQETVQRGFNNALSLSRQPGSVIKPVLPYALAFDFLGYSNKHVIEDGPYAYAGSPVFVQNASRTFMGDITLQDAVIFSLNIPALKTMDKLLSDQGIGYERMAEFLKTIGVDPEIADRVTPGYAIGGGDIVLTPVQVAAIHALVMNKGQYIKPHTIVKVVTSEGEVIESTIKPVQAISPQAAYITAQVMREVIAAPAGTYAILSKQPFPVYGKTGTSDHDDSYPGIPEGVTKDNWLAVSTNTYTNVGWTGFKKFIDEDGTPHYITDSALSSPGLAKLIDLLVENTVNFSTPAEVERPEGVVNINHVLGVYPYVAPVSGMDSQYIANALIIDKFSRLNTLEAEQLASLETQKVEVGKFDKDGLQLKVKIADYPKKDGIDVINKTKVMTATNSLGEVRSATGRVLFHPSWMFGSIQYGTDITLNGKVIKTVKDTNAEREIVVTGVKSNQNIQVCSYYAWDKNETTKSNQICETVNSGKQLIEMPSFVGKPVAEAQAWINTNTKAGITLKQTMPSSKDQIGLIADISPNYSGKEIDQDTLDRANFTITYYDGTVSNLQSYIGQSVKALQNDLARFFTLSGPTNDPNAKITSITVNGAAVNQIKLSEGATITYTVEAAKPVDPTPAPQPAPTPAP